jgi:tRNA threonylcarbamoyl adenosine modification protein YeaZ
VNILSIDTALTGCRVSIWHASQRQYYTTFEDIKRGQAERLVPIIDATVGRAAMKYADISAVVVTNGPGAFTGLRVGLSTARAMALALDVPVLGVSTLDLLYRQFLRSNAGDADNVCVVLETKRDDFYAATWQAGQAELPAQAISGPALHDHLLCGKARGVIIGDAVERFVQSFVQPNTDVASQWRAEMSYNQTSTEVLAEMALEYFTAQQASGYQPINVSPAYLKPADVSLSKKIYKTIG